MGKHTDHTPELGIHIDEHEYRQVPPNPVSSRKKLIATGAVAAAFTTLGVGLAHEGGDHGGGDTYGTYLEQENIGNQHKIDIPVEDLNKDSTVTIKVRKDETAGSIAQDLMAEPEDYTKIVDQIQANQEYPSLLAQGTIEHLPKNEIDNDALVARRADK